MGRSGAAPLQGMKQKTQFLGPIHPAAMHLPATNPPSSATALMRGEVVAASGAWRSSGDWWQEDAWQLDEWDLEIEFSASSPVGAQHRCAPSRQNPNSLDAQEFSSCPQRGLYRIYYDALRQSWFVRGVYD